jgi:hypothetical protein
VANATAKVNKGIVRPSDIFRKRSVETLSAATRFYTHAMVGIDTTGYYCKADDTQSWIFAGVVRGDQGDPLLPAGTAGDGTIDLDIIRPSHIELALTSVAVTDIGKPVYALFDNEGTLDTTATTFANLIGFVADKVATDIALVECAYDGIAANARLGAAKQLAATGTITLTKFDLGKVIVITGTAAQTINLPAIAGCPAGSWIRFVKKSTNAVAATLDGDSSEEIDSSTTLATIAAEHDCALLVSDGTQWHVASRDIA